MLYVVAKVDAVNQSRWTRLMEYTKNIIRFYFLVILISGGALTIELQAIVPYISHGISSNGTVVSTPNFWWWIQILPFIILLILGVIYLKRFFRLWIVFCSLYVLWGQFEGVTRGIVKIYTIVASILFLIASIYVFYRHIVDKNDPEKSLEHGEKSIIVPKIVIWVLLLFLVLPLISIIFTLVYH